MLVRGYAIVQCSDGAVVRSATEADPGESLRLRFTEDSLATTVGEITTEDEGDH